MSYFGVQLRTTPPTLLDADEENVVHVFGAQAAAVAVLVDDSAFDGSLSLMMLNGAGTWVDVSSSPADYEQATQAGQAIDPSGGGMQTALLTGYPVIVARDGFSQIRLKIDAYTSGSVTVTMVDQVVRAPLIHGHRTGATYSDNIGVYVDNEYLTLTGVRSNAAATLTNDDDAAELVGGYEDIFLAIFGDSDGDFIPEIRMGGDWFAASVALFTDIATGDPPAALANGGLYSLDIVGMVSYGVRVRLTSATTGSSDVSIVGKVSVG